MKRTVKGINLNQMSTSLEEFERTEQTKKGFMEKKLQTSENNMLCIIPAKPMTKEKEKEIKEVLQVS